jgi:predicted deacylase
VATKPEHAGNGAQAVRIEVACPDLTPYAAGNCGLPYVWSFRAESPGPHLLIQALTHGNEVCGAIALEFLLRQAIRPLRGTLTLCFANVDAYRRFNPREPFASRCVDEDFNRLWSGHTLDSARVSSELRRARELRPLYERVDHLLDLHSMTDVCPALSLAGTQAKGLALARALGAPEYIVIDGGHAAGKRLRDYAFFDDPDDPRSALLVECGQHWEAAAPRVAQAVCLRFLRHFDALDADVARAHLDPSPAPVQKVIAVTHAVTIKSPQFQFALPVHSLCVIDRADTLIARDGATEIRTPYDACVLVMPHLKPNRRAGETAVRLGRLVS